MSDSPTQAGLLDFIRNIMGISPVYLPDDSALIGYSLDIGMAIVSPGLVPLVTNSGTSIFNLAVYNLAADAIINFAVDQSERTYFKDLRDKLHINNFTPGVITSSSDGGTSQSTLNPEFMKTLTLSNLQHLKTPYGRQYLMFAQASGTQWGLTL